jgi:hypothetical protein
VHDDPPPDSHAASTRPGAAPCFAARARLQLDLVSFLLHGLFYAVGSGVVMALLYLLVWQQAGRPAGLQLVAFQFLTGFWITMLGAILAYPGYRWLAERWHGLAARGKFACQTELSTKSTDRHP